jgi:ABC-type sugar transport system ATPase subunit
LITIEDLCLRQGAFALKGVSLTIPRGRYGVLMGKTGTGKTTVLEAVAGLRRVSAGRILLDGRDVTHFTPAARDVGYVPQDAALFRAMSVRANLAFALTIRCVAASEIDRRVNELADWLGIGPLLDRYPHGLSGGEAQRVALGRALAFRPRILLLDEPLSSLDEETRDHLTGLLRHVREAHEVTVLHVTHNRREAEQLGDVHLRLEHGRIAMPARGCADPSPHIRQAAHDPPS